MIGLENPAVSEFETYITISTLTRTLHLLHQNPKSCLSVAAHAKIYEILELITEKDLMRKFAEFTELSIYLFSKYTIFNLCCIRMTTCRRAKLLERSNFLISNFIYTLSQTNQSGSDTSLL